MHQGLQTTSTAPGARAGLQDSNGDAWVTVTCATSYSMPKQQVGSRPAQRVQGHAGKLLIYTNVIERTMSTDRRIDALHARHPCWSVFLGGGCGETTQCHRLDVHSRAVPRSIDVGSGPPCATLLVPPTLPAFVQSCNGLL